MQHTRRPYDIDSLTDVALRVFGAKGYDGASMDDVAREAGITKAAIYHHVSGKEALLERGLDRALGALDAILSAERGLPGRSAIERLRFLVRSVAETTFRLMPELTVLFRARGNGRAERAAIERRRAFDRAVAAILAEAVADGSVRADLDPRTVTRLIFGMSNSVVEWYRPGTLAPERLVDTIVALVFDGLRV